MALVNFFKLVEKYALKYIFIAIIVSSQVSAKCGNLYDVTWWEKATK